MRTVNEQTLWEIQAYGATKSEILESVTDSKIVVDIPNEPCIINSVELIKELK